MGGGDTGAAVTEPEAPQPLRQAVGEGSPAALADDGLVGAMNLQGKKQIWWFGEVVRTGKQPHSS